MFSRHIVADACDVWDGCTRAGITSLAAVPLIHGDDVIGVVGLASTTVRDFEEHVDFLEALTSVVASALVNARLHETARRELAERQQAEGLLHQVRQVVESSPAVLFRRKAVEGWPVTMVTENVRQFGYSRRT